MGTSIMPLGGIRGKKDTSPPPCSAVRRTAEQGGKKLGFIVPGLMKIK
jgi:hypothetical protein